MSKSICIIGLGQFGRHLARSLARMNCEVMAIDMNESAVQAVRDEVQYALIADVRSLESLEATVSKDFDEAVVSLGESLEASILCTLHLRKLGIPRIRAKASTEDHAAILRAVGATDIIFPERETAERMAQRILNPDLLDYIPLSPEYQVVEINTPDAFIGKSLAQLHLRKEYHVLIVAIKTPDDGRLVFLPPADEILAADSRLVVIGQNEDIEKLRDID